MKYRRFGSVCLLLLLIGFCLYGSKVQITERAASAISEQIDTEATVQTEKDNIEEEQADGDERCKLAVAEPLDEEAIDDSGDQGCEYDLFEIECGQGKTAQVERFYYPQENRAEFKITSDLLNYTAKVQRRADEEDAYTNYYTMDLEITRDAGQLKTQQIQWTCEWTNTSVYPEFLDANWDGCPDLCICEIATVYNGGLCRIYVWDEKKEEYVQAAIENPEAEDYIAADVLPIHSEDCLEQSYSMGFYEKHFQRFRWDGSAFVIIEQIVYVYDEELDDYVEQEHYIKQE